MNILSFEQAIADSEQFNKRHLILGNGFSIACKADIFHYASLFKEADFSAMPEVKQVFETLGTQDFEVAIKALENGARLIPLYAKQHVDVAKTMQSHATKLKDVLVSTIAGNHPEIPAEISDEKFWACRRFLAHFLGSQKNCGQVYTLNYDLLLYWTLMHEDMPFDDPIALQTNDGFGNDEDAPEAEYVVWQGEVGAHNAKVHFLHGALHLFDAGSELKKYTWVRKGEPLIQQIREALSNNLYPLFVSEGTSLQKKNKIRHNAYLYQAYKQLTTNVLTGAHCFFIFGHSLAENDDHLLNRLGRGKFKKLYVSIYGDPKSADNQKIISRALHIASLRSRYYPLDIAFYDSASAAVWG